MQFDKSATNFDIAAAESCPAGRRTAEPPKLPALTISEMHALSPKLAGKKCSMFTALVFSHRSQSPLAWQ